MNYKYPLLFSILILLLSYSQAQPPGGGRPGGPGGPRPEVTVTGKVMDEEGNALPYVSITAISKKDSSIAGGALTDERGNFSFEILAGGYFFKFTLISFKEYVTEPKIIRPGSGEIGNIVMEAEDVELDEVEIRAEKSEMTFKLDKRVFNVGKDLASGGRNAEEILDNVPSVTVDVDGNVSLRGSENVRILVDGKPSNLTGDGGLRSIPGTMIQSVEVITNPSARYDAEGQGGIINIVLKKERKKGINGVFGATVGYPHNHRASFNINMRRKKFNLFADYSFGFSRRPGGGESTQTFFEADTSFSYYATSDRYRGGIRNNGRLGIELFLTPRNTLTFSGNVRHGDGNNRAVYSYLDYSAEDILVGGSKRTDEETEVKLRFETEINYLKTFSKKDQKLSLDFKWMRSDDDEASNILQEVVNSADILQRVNNVEDEQTFFFQGDYVHPFLKDGKIETGIRGSLRQIQNDYGVDQLDSGEVWNPIPRFNNNFVYTENIYAAYVQAGNTTGKFSYMAGLRTEFSQIITELTETNEKNPRTYISFFPSAFLSYKLNEMNSFQLSYSRRIRRPGFRESIPFFGFSDNRNFYGGNPDLDPEFTHSVELGYMRFFKLGSILSSVYYRRTSGVITRVTQTDSIVFTSIKPVNLSTSDAYGIEFNINLEPFKWWRINGNANFFSSYTEGEWNEELLTAQVYTLTGRVSTRFTFWKNANLQLSGNYRGPANTPQGRRKAVGFANLSASKDVLKGNGTITFSVQDILNSRKFRWETATDEFTTDAWFQWRARQFLLSFEYRLNQKKSRRRSGGNFEGGGEDF